MADLFFSTVGELGQKLKAKEISPVELVRAFADRLQRFGPRYNALALPLVEPAIRRAREVEKEMNRGRLRGPLQGIPYAAKDLLAWPGGPTTWGARPYAGQVFDYAATALQRLDKTGAVLVGKLAMVELAGGPSYRYAAASLTGPGLNPWDRTRWAGGSSSGSGAAVAAGLVPFALGSETSGSILTPSAYCGVTGLRPTYGLVSRFGAMPLSWTLDKIGPMCRSAEDCGLVLHEIAGGDRDDPGSAGKSFYYTPQYARKMQDLRIGYAPVDFAERAEPSARPAFESALGALRQTGVQLVEARLPDFPYDPVISTIISCEASSIFEPLITSGKVNELADQRQIAGLKAGLEIPAKDYLRAMRVRRILKDQITRMFSQLDLLVAPAQFGPATKVSEALDAPPTRPMPKDPGFGSLIEAGNLAGMPALSLPCGFADNVPVALQIVGLPFSENTILAVGREFQNRTDFHRRVPPDAQRNP